MQLIHGENKYKDLASIDSSYLIWVVEKWDNVSEELKDEIRRILASRSGNKGCKATASSLDRNQIEDVSQNLEKQFQSDVSAANGEILKGIDLLKDALLEKLKQL
jgi:hypothetical protein